MSEDSLPGLKRSRSRIQCMAPPPLSVKKSQTTDHDFLAYFLQLLACFIWTSSYIYSNQHNFDMFEANLAKGVVGTFLNYFVIQWKGIKTKYEDREHCKWLILINLCVLAYFYMLPLSQLYLPLPIVHTIGCSSIALIYIIDYWVNGTKITKNGIIGVVLGIFGVILMANNRAFMEIFYGTQDFDSKFNNYKQSSAFVFMFVAIVLFLSRVINTYGLVKFKHFPQISVFQLNYFNNIMGTLTAGIGYCLTTDHVSMMAFWPSFFTLGLGQFVCMTFFFFSLKLTKKIGNVMMINGFNIVIAFGISYFRYGQKANAILITGATTLIFSMLLVIWESQKGKNPK